MKSRAKKNIKKILGKVMPFSLSNSENLFPVVEDSFLDVHHHYDTDDFIKNFGTLINSDRQLWEKSLNESAQGKKVLIATLGGGFSHRAFMNMDTILGIALTLCGANVHTYSCDHALPVCLKAEYAYIKPEVIANSQISETLCKGCYKDISLLSMQHGLKNHKMSQYVTFSEKEDAKKISRTIKIDDIAEFKIDGVSVGKHAVSGAMRYFSHSEPTQSQYGELLLRRYLEGAIISYYSIKKLLETEQYESVCLTHGSYEPHGVIKDTCDKMGVRVTSWTVAYLKNRFIFSRGEILHSMLSEPNDLWENMPWSDKHEQKIMSYLDSRWTGGKDWLSIPKETDRIKFTDFASQRKLDLNKPVVGLLTNIIWESYAEYKSRVFPDMLTWIRKTIEYFKSRKDLQLLIRVHPAEGKWHVTRQLAVNEIKKMFSVLPANVFIINSDENVSTYEAMENCDSVLIYQTQTGLELAAQGIPVVVTGDAFVRNKGLIHEPMSESEYFSMLDKLPFNSRMSEEKMKRSRKYAYHAFYRMMIPISFVEESKDWMLYKSTLKNLGELLPDKDKGLDIICEGIMHGTPFIYPSELYDQEGIY